MIKPSVVFILVLCIAGYNFYDRLPKLKFRLKRSSGYHTFLLSASGGMFLFAISAFLYWLCFEFFSWIEVYPSLGRYILIDIYISEATIGERALFDTSVIALLLSYLLPRYYFGDKKEVRKRLLIEFSGDSEAPELTQLFFRSMRFGIPVLFTMSDRKVYIGYILEVHTTDFNDVFILPIFSGYRDKNDLTLVPVTPYQDVLDDIANDLNSSDVDYEKFTVGLPLREILYAHLHDFNYYEKFKEKEAVLKKSGCLSNGVKVSYNPSDINY